MPVVRTVTALGKVLPVTYSKRKQGGWTATATVPAYKGFDIERIYHGHGECRACAHKSLTKKLSGLTF